MLYLPCSKTDHALWWISKWLEICKNLDKMPSVVGHSFLTCFLIVLWIWWERTRTYQWCCHLILRRFQRIQRQENSRCSSKNVLSNINSGSLTCPNHLSWRITCFKTTINTFLLSLQGLGTLHHLLESMVNFYICLHFIWIILQRCARRIIMSLHPDHLFSLSRWNGLQLCHFVRNISHCPSISVSFKRWYSWREGDDYSYTASASCS